MMKRIGVILVLFFAFNLCHAQILTFDFAGIVGNEATVNSNSNDANLSSSTISRGAGLNAASNADRYNADGWALTSIANAVTGNEYMQFTITPNGGYQFSVSSIVFQIQRSGTGLTAVALRNSLDGYAANLDAQKSITDNTSTQTITFTFTQSSSASAVTYRLYGYAEAGTGTGGPGDGTGNDIVVNGSVTSGCTAPTTQATFTSLTSVTSSTLDLNFTRGNGDGGVLVIAKATTAPTDPSSGTGYTGNTVFGSGTSVGGGYAIYSGTGNGTGNAMTVSVSNLTPNTIYYFTIYEFNSTGTCYHLTEVSGNTTTLCNDPTTSASGAAASSIGSTTATVSCTAGDGDYRLIVIKSGSVVTGSPSDGTTYGANTVFGSGGTIAANEYVVYANTSNTVNVTGLTASTTYYVSVFEYNNATKCYKTSSPSTTSFTTASAESDVIAVAASESATISSTNNDNAPLTSGTGVQVWSFTIRDGGSDNTDVDNLPTIVNAITFAQAAGNAVANWSQAIKTVSLFDGATNIATATVTATQIQFTGLTITVNDESSKTLTVRLSLNCGIGASNDDGDDFGFSLSNANFTLASSGSSQKSSFSAQTSTNAQNVISVVATKLVVSTQPSTTGVNIAMTPNVVITATDACGNIDLGYTGTISITSLGTLSGTPVSTAAVAGVATYSTLTHTATGTGLTLSASAAGLTGITTNTFDIVVVTVFSVGDIAMVGICVNMNGCQGSTQSGEDEISFVSFEDITPGTSIDITDNGFERVTCGSSNWGNTEGVIRITRNTSTITKGTVVTIRVYDESIFAGVQPDNNWTVTYPNTGYGQFNLNGTDEQVYLMQGGTWNKGTSNTHDATYTGGTLMFALNTYTAWSCNNNTTTRGDLPLGLKCYNALLGSASSNMKYTGATTATDQKTWIDRLNSAANWTGYGTCAAYIAGGLDYGGSTQTFTINAGGFSSGIWTGASNTDWFDCNNWQNYRVPDSTINVQIDNVANDPVVGAPPALYPLGAFSNNLTITNTSGNGVLTINNASSILTIKGNFTNNGTLTHSNGRVTFRGTSTQTVSGSNSFYNLFVHNLGSTGLSLSNDVTVTNDLYLIDGVISTGANRFHVTNTSASVPSLFSSSSFINGNLRRYIATNTSTYNFPIGYGGSASTDYHPVAVVNNNLTGVSYINASVSAASEGSGNNLESRLNAEQDASPISYAIEGAEWSLSPSASPSGGSYGVNLYTINLGALSGQDDKFCPMKRDSSSSDYADYSTFEGSTTIPTDGAAGRIYNSGNGYAQRLGYTTFSKHIIGLSPEILPIKLSSLSAFKKETTSLLTWRTASEINNDYFNIERSANGKDFKGIGKIDGHGTTNETHDYSFIDNHPENGINYYRLNQFDFDGKNSFSPTVSLKFEEKIKSTKLDVYIVNEKLTILTKEYDGTASISVYDATGRVMMQNEIALSKDSKIELALPHELNRGIYFVQLNVGGEMLTTKVVY